MSDNKASSPEAEQPTSLYCPAADNEAVETTAAELALEEAQAGDSEPSDGESLGSCDSSEGGVKEANDDDEEDYMPDGVSTSSSEHEPLKRSRSTTPVLSDDDDDGDDDLVEKPHQAAAAVRAPSKKVRRPKTYG